jgi:sigma-B regulation protein RsbU (phosphoserine phosphatase)
MDAKHFKILLIEHEKGFAEYIKSMLEQSQLATFEVVFRESFESGLARLVEGGVDLVLLDLSLPDGAGLANVERAQAENLRVPIIVLGPVDDEIVAYESVHAGAQDYLVKGQLNPQLLGRAIRYAIERELSDAALFDAEEKYRGIFEHIVEGIFQTSPEGRYLGANPALAKIYGYSSPEELIHSIKDISKSVYVEPGRRDQFIQIMLEHDTVTDFESRIYRKDGSIIWIAENVRAVRNSKGQLLYYEGTVLDISRRKQAQEKLRHSEALYHSLVETLPQNIFRKDLEGRFTFVNQRFCASLGKTSAEIVGRTDFDFFPPEMASKYQKDDRAVIAEKRTFETVEQYLPPGSELVYVQVVKTPIIGPMGEVVGLQGIFWDISERKRAEERERLSAAELARSREALRVKNEEMEEDLKMARDIQLNLLPQQYPVFPHGALPEESLFHFSHRYIPTGAVGGDYFNILPVSDSMAGVLICDVMGHGVRSALVAAMIRALVEELKPHAADPGRFLTQFNRDVCSILKQTGSKTLVTAFYLVADAATGAVRFANAGHPKPFLLRKGAHKVESLAYPKKAPINPAIGLIENAEFSVAENNISPGDKILFFTDGLYEVDIANQEIFTIEMLGKAVEKCSMQAGSELLDDLLAEIRSHSVEQDFADDVCLVSMELSRLKPQQ